MTPTLLYLFGPPGAGKTTLMSALLQGWAEAQAYEQPFAFRTRVHPSGETLLELGRLRPPFSGTDTLSMSVGPLACAWIGERPHQRIAAEGDRLAYDDFWTAAAPERFANQMRMVERTQPEWVIAGTPFTTVTVNNTYPTGVHTDAGDLPEGFGNLAVLRYGEYRGGLFTFPRYRVGIDMQHRDVLICDVHEWHGNTAMELLSEDAERISVVCYYRRDAHKCGTAADEAQRALLYQHRHEEGAQAAQAAAEVAATVSDE